MTKVNTKNWTTLLDIFMINYNITKIQQRQFKCLFFNAKTNSFGFWRLFNEIVQGNDNIIISMFILIAFWLFKTLDNIKTPCSVKTYGKYRLPPLLSFEVPNWYLKELNSSSVNWNIKKPGNRSIFLFTALFIAFVSIPYNLAKSLSSMTFCPRISWIMPWIVIIWFSSIILPPLI